jgi:U3 small nucleolar RNA-associated protein 13
MEGVVSDTLDDDEDDGMDADAITSYALSHDDEILITVSQNHLIRQYYLAAAFSWKESKPAPILKTWGRSGHALPVTHMELHISNVFLATGSVDGTVRIWDIRGGYVTHVFRPMQSDDNSGMHAVSAINWKQDSTQLVIAIGREDGTIVVHDLRKEDNVIVMRDHVSAVTCMEWTESDEQPVFVSAGRDAVLNTWKITKIVNKKKKKQEGGAKYAYQRIHTLPIYEQVEGMAIVNSDESSLLVATAGSKGMVRLWKATVSSTSVSGFESVAQQSISEAFGSDRGGYMGLSYNRHVLHHDEDKSQDQLIVPDAEHNLSFLHMSNKEKPLLTLDRTIVGHNDEILDLVVIPNADSAPTKIAVATNSAQVRLFELGTFSCNALDGHSATVLCVDVSPCGRYLATSGKDKTMRLWHVESERCVAIATGHTEAVGAAALSRKVGRYEVGGKAATNGGGSFAITASKDRTLKRWNLPGATDLNVCAASEQSEIALRAFVSVRAHEKDINIVSIAPNDSLIASGSQDKTVKLWKSTDLTLKATLKGHRRGVWDCQFSPFDRVLATSSGDRTIKLWSLGDYCCVRTFQGHAASALRVRFLSGGLQLVSSGADGLVKLWTIRTNECETTMDGHTDKVWALDISMDGKTLVSGGADSRIIVWEDTTQAEEEAKRATEEQTIIMEQNLANHLRHKEFEQALEIALALEKPMQTLKVLNSIVENDVQKGKDGLGTLQRHVSCWPMDRTTQVIRYCRDWNTRARNSHIAMLVIKAVVTTIPARKLAKADGVPELLAGITPYSERHFSRLDNLITGSYLLDYTLFSMGHMDVDDVAASKEYMEWESNSKLVLPPKQVDGRIQIGGAALVGLHRKAAEMANESDDEVVTIGSSGSSDDDESMADHEEESTPAPAVGTKQKKATVVEQNEESSRDSDSSSNSSEESSSSS